MSDEQEHPPHPTGLARLIADARRLAHVAAKVGVVLALLCHLAPPSYRPLCEELARFCSVGE